MTEQNNGLLAFIAKDTAASGQIPQLRLLSLAILVLLPTTVVFLMGTNPNLQWLDSPRAWVFVFFFLSALVLFSLHIRSGKNARLLQFTTLATAATALILPVLATEAPSQSIQSDFWLAVLRCFILGFTSSVGAASLLIILFFKKGPLPTGPVKFSIASLSSVVGVTVLFLHCPDTHLDHIATGHGLQFAAVLALTSFVINRIFSRIVRSQLGSFGRSFSNFSNFGK